MTRFQRFALAILVPILTVVGLATLVRIQSPDPPSIQDQETLLWRSLQLSGVQIDSVGINAEVNGYFAVVDIIVGDDLEGSLLKVLNRAGGLLSTGAVQINRFIIGLHRDSNTMLGTAWVSAEDVRAFSQARLLPDELIQRIEFKTP